VTAEEERFGKTLASGLRQLEGMLAQRGASDAIFSGADAFKLYDTYGFPLDLTVKILASRGISVDEAGYDTELDAQRRRGQEAAQFKRGAVVERWAERALPPTTFTGYSELQSWGHVLALEVDGEEMGAVQRGQTVALVLDRTPFYAESGGQVGDAGALSGPHGKLLIEDVQKPVPGVFVHRGRVLEGEISLGEQVELKVDAARRRDIVRNHTATHLLHRALRDTLGDHAEQKGSLVAPDRLRFDFNNQKAVSPAQLQTIEDLVNGWIRADTPVEAAEMPQEAARKLGAMALFGEKYGDIVRMVTVGCDHGGDDAHPGPEASVCSRELCGGIHVGRTGEIGFLRIVSEGSVAAGVRRIEAVSGRGATEWVKEQSALLRTLAEKLAAQPTQIEERLDALLAEQKTRKQELERLRAQVAAGQVDHLLGAVREHNGTRYLAARVDAADADSFRSLGEQLRARIESGVVVLGTVVDNKPLLLAAVTPDQVKAGRHAGNIVKALAGKLGGGGGGRPDFAQAGGRDSSGLDQALADVAELLN
jgi:alanyl-tRNA synthetase